MTRMNKISRFAAVAALAFLIAAPVFAARGKADFTRFVALGDSYGAGVESSSLNDRHQPYSWPAIVARQAGVPDFVQPLVSFPGIGPELQLNDIVSYPPVIAPAPGLGQPELLTLPRPYSNLSIPGAQVGDLTTLTGKESPSSSTAALFAQFILRGQGTAVQQALAQHPTFIAIWIGGNDLLGGALNGTPKFLTPTDKFKTAYGAMLDQLIAGAPDAGMVVGNLPTNGILPIFTTVPPVLVNPATRLPVLGPNGQPIFLVGELGDGTTAQLPPGTEVLLSCSDKLATGMGIPAALKADPNFAKLPNVGVPLPDSCTLTPAEQAAIQARAAEFNQAINDAASSRNIPVADINGLFNQFAAATGYHAGPFVFSPAYITGGLFSLDGLHLTDIGYTLFADQYIRTINQAYGTSIPLASIAQFMANNGGVFPNIITTSGLVFVPGSEWTISAEAEKAIQQWAAPAKTHKLRVVGH